jgi:APA family basic amino acid/polyamine antiporter
VGRIADPAHLSLLGVLRAAGLLFFAFAGYARIATLGEEVRDPERTIPQAIPRALGAVQAVYALTGLTALAVLGAGRLARSDAPLAAVVAAAGAPALTGVVRAGAVIAVAGVLLALIAGIGRTALAMARRGDLPRPLAVVSPRHQVPARAQLAVAGAVIALAGTADLGWAIGLSSCTVLVYYAIANASALTLPGPRLVPAAGLAGCLVLAASVPWQSLATGAAALSIGVIAREVRVRRASGSTRRRS